MSLEVNTFTARLKDVVEKIVRSKLGMNSPMIMLGASLIFEVGDDLDEEEAAIYSANLEKVNDLLNFNLFLNFVSTDLMEVVFLQVLSKLPTPVTSGIILKVEDLQQELSCNINIKHRFFFLFVSLGNDFSLFVSVRCLV